MVRPSKVDTVPRAWLLGAKWSEQLCSCAPVAASCMHAFYAFIRMTGKTHQRPPSLPLLLSLSFIYMLAHHMLKLTLRLRWHDFLFLY